MRLAPFKLGSREVDDAPKSGSRFFFSSFLGKFFLLTLPAVLLAHHLAHGASPPPAKKVLLLYSYQAMLPGNLEWDEAIRAALKGTEAQPLEFFTEFLDLSQFPDESYVKGLLNLLQIKYSSRKIDLLIPVGDLAFAFLQAHGDALFPGSPSVFCAVARQQVEALKPLPNTSGAVAWADVQGTLAAALKLQPNTRRVVVVGGTAKTDRAFQHIAREALRPNEGRLEVTFLTDLPMTEILQRLSSLPPQTLVIYLSMFRDSTGHVFVPLEALKRVAQAANAPVYGLWETLLGHGIVGGHLMSFKEQGRLAGEMGSRVLNGEKPENIPIVYEGADVYAFDWRRLQRWGLKESDLPPGSLVRFKEPSLWESHKREVIGTIAAFCLLTLLTIGLLVNLGRRRLADKKLRQAELEYRIVADFTYDWEYWKNLDGTLRYVSPSCERISGYRPEDFIRRPDLFREIVVPEDRDLWDAHDCNALEKPGARECQFRVQRPDGAIRWIEHVCQPVTDDEGKFIGIRASNRDITERKQAEIQEQQHREDLARVGRVATLSELTGTLAHEIIQPLMAIMNNSQAARRLLDNLDPDLDEVMEILEDITRGSQRASGVIQQLRQHLKPGPPELTRLDLNDLVQSLIPLVSRQAAINHINLVCQLTKGLPPVTGNRIQLEQVILNLVVNSIEAIKGMADGPGEIVLQTDREDDHALRVSVMDSGPGVKPEDLKLLFDPFFTTKKEGMGLGLSISRSIIKAHRGRLWAAPNPGGGTALYITLPVSQEER
jgi:PAS domain S-box-containing protein